MLTTQPIIGAAVAASLLGPTAGLYAACGVIVGDKDGNGTADLRIVGTTTKQNAVVGVRAAGYAVAIDCNGNGSYTDAGDVNVSGPETIETYSIELGGTDTVTVRQVEDLVGARKDIVFTLAGAASSATFTTQGHPLLGASSLEIEAVGVGAAANTVTLDFSGSTVDKSLVAVRTDLGPGNDNLKVLGPSKVSASVIDLGLRAGGGNNTVTTTDGKALVTASTIVAHISGDDTFAHHDTMLSTFAGQLAQGSRLHYAANLLNGGPDETQEDRWTGTFDLRTFAIDPTTAAGTSEAYFNIRGGGGFDDLKVTDSGTSAAAKINGLLSFFLDGGNQPDNLALDWDGIAGYGRFRFWADGGVAYDQIDVGLVTGGTSHNDIDLYAGGGPENDIGSPNGDYISGEVYNYGAATFGFGRAVILDGGLDYVDTCDFVGTAPHVALNCEAGSW